MLNNNDIEILFENKDVKKLRCPHCGSGTITLEKDSAYHYSYCDTCDSAYIDYEPLPHQLDVHLDNHKLKLLIGGMGSAKSRCGVMEIIDHALFVKNGRTAIFAQTLKQLSKAIMPIFKEYLPDKFIEKWTDTKTDIEIELTNGHTIIGFASDDEEKIRSLDITAFYIEEASGVSPKLLKECIRRLRNKKAVIDGREYFLGLVVSNPAQGFIRDLLFTASVVKGSPSIKETVAMYKDRIVKPNPDLAAFLSSSRDNIHLPKGFVQSVINSLSPQEVRLYVDCIIEYAEGAVYPDILQHTVDDFEIPRHWQRYVAHDPGINDPAAILLGAMNPDDGTIYFYREYYKKGQVLTQVAQGYKEMTKDIPQGYLKPPLIDPSANKRSKVTGRSYKSQMAIEFDIHFKDANNSIIDGIAKVNNMFYHNKIKIFKSLKHTLDEGCEYRYPTQEERNKNKNLGDLPLDKNNHCLTGDTLVHTVEGLVPIKDLVGKKGQVYCYDEKNKTKTISNFFDVRKTRENTEIVQIETDKGIIKCTPDHLILTTKGWIEAGNLDENSLIISID